MFIEVTLQLLQGFGESLKVFCMTLLFAIPLGLLVCFGSTSKFPPLKGLMRGFVWIIRGTPLMLQLIIVFYGPGLVIRYFEDFPGICDVSEWLLRMFENIPALYDHIGELHTFIMTKFPENPGLYELLDSLPKLSRMEATIVSFSINYACYFSEIYRGGIQSIAQGQYEAGQVLGMTKPQIFFRIVLLQVIKRIMAPMSNEIITLVKDTSLARIISVYEIIWAGESFIKKGLLWPLFYTGIFYLVFNGVLTVLFAKIEKKLNYFKS